MTVLSDKNMNFSGKGKILKISQKFLYNDDLCQILANYLEKLGVTKNIILRYLRFSGKRPKWTKRGQNFVKNKFQDNTL